MPSEAVAVVEEIFRRFGSGEEPFSLMSEDIVWDVAILDIPTEHFSGHRGVAEFFRRWIGTWDKYRVELEEAFDAPDGRVLAYFREEGYGRGSGVPVELNAGGVWTIRDGKAIAYRGYADREEARRDAGL